MSHENLKKRAFDVIPFVESRPRDFFLIPLSALA